jgi:Type IV secretion system pilin
MKHFNTIQRFYLASLASLFIQIHEVHAENWLWTSDTNLRSGNVGFEDIPRMIVSVTNWLLGFVGAVSVIMIIYWAVRLGYGAVTGDKETGKKIITASIIGFVIAVSGWFIVNFLIANF